MPETLIAYALARLSDFPQATFSETELRECCQDDFEKARDGRLLRYVQIDVESASYPCSSPFCVGESRTVASMGSELFAICSCSALESPTRIEESDLRTWRLDLDQLCQLFVDENGLGAAPEALNDRLIYLGRTTKGGTSFGIVLGLLALDQVRVYLDALPRLLTESHDRLLVLCAGFRPTQELNRHYEPRRIVLVALAADDPLSIDREAFGAAPAAPDLGDAEREEIEVLGLQTSVRVHVGGQAGSRTLVKVNGLGAELTRIPFRLFMRVLVARFESSEGWVSVGTMMGGGGLIDEGYYKAEGLTQAWNRMREPFGAALQGLRATDLLEVLDGRGRISTPRGRITWQAKALREHRDPEVRELFERLRTATQTSAAAERAGPESTSSPLH